MLNKKHNCSCRQFSPSQQSSSPVSILTVLTLLGLSYLGAHGWDGTDGVDKQAVVLAATVREAVSILQMTQHLQEMKVTLATAALSQSLAELVGVAPYSLMRGIEESGIHHS